MKILTTTEIIALARKHPRCDAETVARAIDEATESVIECAGYSGGDDALIRAAVYVMAESDLTPDEDKAVRLPYLSAALIDAYRQGGAA